MKNTYFIIFEEFEEFEYEYNFAAGCVWPTRTLRSLGARLNVRTVLRPAASASDTIDA